MSWFQGTDEERRQRVIEETQKPLSPDDKVFLSWLGDESWRVRKEAVTQMSHHPDCPKLVPVLIDAMADEDNAGLRNSAFSLLEAMGSLAVEPLLAKANTPDEGLRKFVIDLLGFIPDKRAHNTLMAALSDECINVRLSAVESLGKVGVKEAIPYIEELIANSHDPISLSTALEALYQLDAQLPVELLPQLVGIPLIGPSLVKILSNSDHNIMGKALINIAISENYGLTARVAALSCLLPLFESQELSIPTNGEERSRLAELLTRLLGTDNRDRQILALKLTKYFLNQELLEQALINADNVNLASYLAPIMLTYSEEAIIKACEKWSDYPEASQELILNTIARLGITKLRTMLLDILADEKYSLQIRRAAISALRTVGDISTMEVLVVMLNSADEGQSQVAASALKSLCFHLGEQSQQVLRSLLRNLSPNEVIVELFGNIATEDELPLFLNWLGKEFDDKVRGAAIKALHAFPGKVELSRLYPALNDINAGIRSQAVLLVAEMEGKEANGALLSAIEDLSLPVALAAIESLGQHKSPETINTLKQVLSRDNTPKAIAALEVLINIDSDNLPEILELACQASDPEIVKEAIGAIERLAPTEQKRLLLPLLKHQHWSVRLMALQMMMAFDISISDNVLEDIKIKEHDPMVLELLEEFGR